MSRQATDLVWGADLTDFDPTKKLVLVALADYANPEDGPIFPGMDTLAAKAGVSTRQAQRWVHELLDQKWILLVTPATNYSPAVYQLNVDKLQAIRRPARKRRGKAGRVGVTAMSPQAVDLGVTPVTELGCHGRPNWGDTADRIGVTSVSPELEELTRRAEPEERNNGHSPEKSSSNGGDPEGRDPELAALHAYRQHYRRVLGTEPMPRPPEEKKLQGIAKVKGWDVLRLLELFFETDATNYSVWAFEKSIPDLERDLFFDDLWDVYPRQEDHPQAREVWKTLKVDEALLATMLETLEWQRRLKRWTEDNGRYVPLLKNWLRDRRWEDEPYVPPSRILEDRGPSSVRPMEKAAAPSSPDRSAAARVVASPDVVRPPFERFWEAYPKEKRGGEQATRRLFDSLNLDEARLSQMLDDLEGQRRSDDWTRDDGRHIPTPFTWLRRWMASCSPADGKPLLVGACQRTQTEADDDPGHEASRGPLGHDSSEESGRDPDYEGARCKQERQAFQEAVLYASPDTSSFSCRDGSCDRTRAVSKQIGSRMRQEAPIRSTGSPDASRPGLIGD